MSITYRVANLFNSLPPNRDTITIIPHICNDSGGWGAGFVVPLGAAYPSAENSYRRWHEFGYDYTRLSPFRLGRTQVIKQEFSNLDAEGEVQLAQHGVFVANMIAQKGTVNAQNPTPIRYLPLGRCMNQVGLMASKLKQVGKVEIHAPAFGSGLAGGNWALIAEMVKEQWRNVDVFIYTLTQEEQDNLWT